MLEAFVFLDDDELVSINSGGALEKFESSFVFEAEASTPGGLPRRSGAFEPSLPGTPQGGVVQIVCRAEYPP